MTVQLERSYRPPRVPTGVVAPASAASTAAAASSVMTAARPAEQKRTDQPRRPARYHPAGPVVPRPRVPARRRPPSGVVPSATIAATQPTACESVTSPGYRLGRWARLTMTVSVLVLGVLFATGALPVDSHSDGGGIAEVTVRHGDTLFSIARQSAPGQDVLAVAEHIRRMNGLDPLGTATALPAGLVLRVPIATNG